MFHNCGQSAHPDTARRRSKQHAGLVHTPADSLKPSFGTRWSADEKFKGADYRRFAVMDATARLVLSRNVSAKKTAHNATSLPKAARGVAGFRLGILVAGGLHAYAAAFRKGVPAMPGPAPDSHRGLPLAEILQRQRPRAVQRGPISLTA